jgi:hypothetical protein
MSDLSIDIISLAHAPVHLTDFSVVNIYVDELSSARIWQDADISILSRARGQPMLKLKTHSGFHD